tara:strand:+ start:1845 stop:2111 length:267 start_codon:yes stop_codon:yes gene_type:complete
MINNMIRIGLWFDIKTNEGPEQRYTQIDISPWQTRASVGQWYGVQGFALQNPDGSLLERFNLNGKFVDMGNYKIKSNNIDKVAQSLKK